MSGLKPPTTTKVVKSSGLPRPTNTGALAAHNRTTSKESLLSVGSHTTEDWAVGDRCYAGGTKAGTIAFIGEVKFQPGEWAGVILDEAAGKNDGSVAGIRYFQCSANRGLFCKLNRLTRHSMEKPQLPSGPKMSTEQMLNLTGSSEYQASDNQAEKLESDRLPSGSIDGSFAPLSPTMSDMADLDSTFGVTSTPVVPGNTLGLRLNEKVVVGTKSGILRYIGDFHLKEGTWGGVELDKPLGKNDGSVDSKRYFACRPMYGLFAPIGKISRAPSLPGSITATPEVKQTRSSIMRQQKGLGGSQESLSSLSSFQSSASRRVKLGVTAITSSGSSQKAHNRSTAVASPVTLSNSMQESLREKEQHVEQLLRERDMERSEMARTNLKLESLEQKLMEIQQEKQRLGVEMQQRIDQLQSALETADVERKQLIAKLDEEKRRSDDLMFRMEEEIIQRNDLESKLEEIKVQNMSASPLDESIPQSPELERKNAELTAKVNGIQKQLEITEKKVSEYEVLLEQLRQQELDLREKHLQSETKFEANIREKEQLITANEKQAKSLVDDNKDKECEIQKLQSNVNELTLKMQDEQRLCLKLDNEAKLLGVKAETAERLAHDRLEQIGKLNAEKTALEQQMLMTSGSNKEQVELNEAKNNEIATLVAKLNESEAVVTKLNQQVTEANEKFESLAKQLTDKEEKLTNFSKEYDDLQKKLSSFDSLRAETEARIFNQEAELNSLKTNETKSQEAIAKLNAELEKVRESLKADADAQAQKLIEENDALKKDNFRLLEVERERDELRSKHESLDAQNKLLEEQLTKIGAQAEISAKELLQKQETCQNLTEQAKTLEESQTASKLLLTEAQATITSKATEIDALKEIEAKMQEETNRLKADLERLKDRLKADTDSRLHQLTQENEVLRKENSTLLDVQTERDKLRQTCESLTDSSKQLTSEYAHLKEKADKLCSVESEREGLKQHLTEVSAELESSKNELNCLKTELSTFTSTGDEEKKKLLAQIETLKNEVADAVALRHVREESKLKLKDLDGRLNTITQEKLGLESELTIMKESLATFSAVQTEHEKVKQELESLREQEFNLATELDRQKSDSQATIQSLQSQLNEKIGELQKERKKQNSTTSEVEVISKRVEELEEENRQLRRSVVNLETNLSLAVAKQNTNETAPSVKTNSAQESDELSSYRQQVDFLNSVIVDLNSKLKVLGEKYEAALMGYSNGESSNDAKTKTIPPRLYCDICEEFDQHDTDDCPQQFTEDLSAHSQYHGERGQSRPFCSHCQIFGHWTESCDGTETF